MKVYETMFGKAIAKIEKGKTVVYLEGTNENKTRVFDFNKRVKPSQAIDYVINGILNRSIPKDYEVMNCTTSI